MIRRQTISLSGKLCLMALLLAACAHPPSDSSHSSNPYLVGERISKVDKEIQQLEAKIQGTRDEINQMAMDDHEVKGQLEKGVLFPYDSKYAMTGGQNSGDPNDGRLVRVTKDLEFARKTLEQQKQELKKLTAQKQNLQQQSMGCFPAETLVVMADGSKRPFDEIRVGDLVQTYDIGYEKNVPRKVIEVYQVDGNHLYLINGELRTSGGERLLSQDGWREVRNLKIGDSVHVAGRMLKIESIELTREDKRLFNMQVADTHNFYVSGPDQGAILVHNSGGGGGGGGK